VRVLHVTDRLDARGGAQRFLLGLLEAQAAGEAGAWEPHVAAAGRDAATPCPCPLTLVPGLDARERDATPLGALDDLLRRLRPARLHLHTVVNPALLEWAAAQRALATVQDHRAFCPTRGKWTRDGRVCHAQLETETCRACFDDAAHFARLDALTHERLRALRPLRLSVLSEYMRAELVAIGAAPERVHVTPPWVHGLPLDAPRPEPSCVLFAGRLAETKGVWDAACAWRRSGTRLPLVFAGTGPQRGALERSGFEVRGWLSPAALAAAYRSAAALLMPSRWQEPCGIVGLEALALGTPVVAWESGGVAEWHPGPLAPWGDTGALAGLLQDALAGHLPAPRARPGFERATALERLEQAYAAES
jgi:glycosyltransferase involved in cell wall biosynthesis